MSNFFTNCDILVNNSGILAESANFSASNSIEDLKVVGYREGFTKIPNGNLQTSLNLNYFLEVNNDPIYERVKFLRTGYDNFTFSPDYIVAAGVTGGYYLQNYNLSLVANQAVKISTSFIGFQEPTGQFQSNTAAVYNTTNSLTNGSEVSYTKNGRLSASSPKIYAFSYVMDVTWLPEYILGQNYPIQVQLGQKTETIKISQEIFKKNEFSGISFSDYFGTIYDTLVLYSTGIGLYQVPLDGFTVKNTQSDLNLDNIAIQTITLIK